jgi:hypothetical protein
MAGLLLTTPQYAMVMKFGLPSTTEPMMAAGMGYTSGLEPKFTFPFMEHHRTHPFISIWVYIWTGYTVGVSIGRLVASTNIEAYRNQYMYWKRI